MRHASFVKKDAENIIDERYTALTGLITKEIEKAAAQGLFSAYVFFGTDIEQSVINYLQGILEKNGYGYNFYSDQKDGTTLKVEW